MEEIKLAALLIWEIKVWDQNEEKSCDVKKLPDADDVKLHFFGLQGQTRKKAFELKCNKKHERRNCSGSNPLKRLQACMYNNFACKL